MKNETMEMAKEATVKEVTANAREVDEVAMASKRRANKRKVMVPVLCPCQMVMMSIQCPRLVHVLCPCQMVMISIPMKVKEMESRRRVDKGKAVKGKGNRRKVMVP